MSVRQTFSWPEKLPTLVSGGPLLRALESSDIPALHEIFGDPEVTRYWSSPALDSVEAAGELLDESQQAFSDRRLFQWGIADGNAGVVIGTCTIFNVVPAHRRCEIGFALARHRWGRGEAFRAVSALVEFAFNVLDLRRIEADVDPRNGRSLRLLERLGFQREGLLRERYHVNGELQDSVVLGLLRSGWQAPPLSDPTLRRT